MSTLALVAPAPSRRRQLAIVLVFWLAAAGLIGGQYLLLRHLGSLNQEAAATTGQLLLPSPRWRLSGIFLPLMLIGTALSLQRRWLAGIWSEFGSIGLVILVPFAALCLFLSYYGGLQALDRTQVAGGGFVTLALDDRMFTDAAFVLVEPADPGGLVWRQISVLNHVEDESFNTPLQLVAAPDGRWLLVRRAGIWTDVFRVTDGHPVPIVVPVAGNPGNAAFWRLRSAWIAAMTGLSP